MCGSATVRGVGVEARVHLLDGRVLSAQLRSSTLQCLLPNIQNTQDWFSEKSIRWVCLIYNIVGQVNLVNLVLILSAYQPTVALWSSGPNKLAVHTPLNRTFLDSIYIFTKLYIYKFEWCPTTSARLGLDIRCSENFRCDNFRVR